MKKIARIENRLRASTNLNGYVQSWQFRQSCQFLTGLPLRRGRDASCALRATSFCDRLLAAGFNIGACLPRVVGDRDHFFFLPKQSPITFPLYCT